MSLRVPSLLLAAATAFSLAGCFVQSKCYSDADCAGGRRCCEAEQECLEPGACCDHDDCSAGSGCLLTPGQGHGSCATRCEEDIDCPRDEICRVVAGVCEPAQCDADADCQSDLFTCRERRCTPRGPLGCPDDMVPIENLFCIDIYEASRPDATAGNAGVASTVANSRPGVKPWQVLTNQQAQAACEAAGKSLCSDAEWYQACAGPALTTYAYGEAYSATTCNGIDKYCYCGAGETCADTEPCPYPGCWGTCGADLHLDPTGSNSGCFNAYGVYDMNGNVWEHVLDGDAKRVRGGAYNCKDSKTLHRCDYIPAVWTPSALGFRCCAPGVMEIPDGGSADEGSARGDPGAGDASGGD